jgi:predicted lactoylglutathione lyase
MPANKTLVSGRDATETLLCLMVAKKEDVDKMIEGGGSKGGKVDPTKLPEMEGHYGRSVEDPDGHIWEIGCFTMSKGCTDASKECADLPKGD